MHIPSGSSATVELTGFDQALELSGMRGDYDSEKWLYVPDYYTEYRYILGVRGRDPLICIGVNPSTAEPENLDNTLKSVERIANFNGYQGWTMFNVYAQRATRPDYMDRELNETLHRENMRAFEYILKSAADCGVSPAIWAAWGAVIEKRDYLPLCVRDMVILGNKYGAHWLCAGKRSKAGHPHHPLYLKKDEKTVDFGVTEYLKSL